MGIAIEHSALPPALLSAAIDQFADGIVILDAQDKISLVNQAAERMLGWIQPELFGKSLEDLMHANQGKRQLMRHIHAEEPSIDVEAVIQKRDGMVLPVNFTVAPFKSQGQLEGTMITFRESIKTTSMQHVINAKYFYESNTMGVILCDMYGQISDVNETFLNMVGYTREEFKTRQVTWKTLTPLEYTDLDEIALNQLRENKICTPFEKQYIHKDGSRVDVLVGMAKEEGTEDAYIVFVTDITSRKRTERTLVEDEKLFRAMAEASTVLIWLIDPDNNLVYVNRTQLEFIGSTFEEVIEKGWAPYVHPDDLPNSIALLEQAIKSRSNFQFENRSLHADGAYRWLLASGGPVITADGEFMGYVGTAVDIHDLKVAKEELATYAQKLERSNKELEHFATIASHDLQEPLRKVMIFSEHLKTITKNVLNAEAQDDLERMQRATHRMQRMISDLLDLSRVTRRGQPFKSTNLNLVCREVLADLSYKIKETQARIEVSKLPMIDADASQVHQMLFQLIDNSLKFCRKDVPLVIKIESKLLNSKHYQLVIEDNGQGFKEEYAAKIFDTFIRLHHEVDSLGTGIGLSIVHKIVERHGGTITARGELGKGAIFTICLPVKQLAD